MLWQLVNRNMRRLLHIMCNDNQYLAKWALVVREIGAEFPRGKCANFDIRAKRSSPAYRIGNKMVPNLCQLWHKTHIWKYLSGRQFNERLILEGNAFCTQTHYLNRGLCRPKWQVMWFSSLNGTKVPNFPKEMMVMERIIEAKDGHKTNLPQHVQFCIQLQFAENLVQWHLCFQLNRPTNQNLQVPFEPYHVSRL